MMLLSMPTETPFVFKGHTPDPGTKDFLWANLDRALQYNPTSALFRYTEANLAKYDLSEGFFGAREKEKIDPEKLNEEFGIEGRLTFSEPTSRMRAEILHDRAKKEADLDYIINAGSTGLARTGAGFVAGILGNFVDPVNIAAAVIPGAKSMEFAKTMVAKGWSPMMAGFTKAALDSAFYTATMEPLLLWNAKDEQSHYTLADSMINLGAGALLGGLFEVGGIRRGVEVDKLVASRRSALVNKYTETMLETAEAVLGKTDPETQHKMSVAQVSRFLEDEPMTSASKIMQVVDEQGDVIFKDVNSPEALNEIVRRTGLEPDAVAKMSKVERKALLESERLLQEVSTLENIRKQTGAESIAELPDAEPYMREIEARKGMIQEELDRVKKQKQEIEALHNRDTDTKAEVPDEAKKLESDPDNLTDDDWAVMEETIAEMEESIKADMEEIVDGEDFMASLDADEQRIFKDMFDPDKQYDIDSVMDEAIACVRSNYNG